MSTQIHISNKLRNGAIEGMANAAETGGQAVKVRIYSAGSGIPANHNVVLTDQVLLAEHVSSSGSDGFENSATTGSLNANAFADVAASESGNPAFFRMIDANGEVCMQGTAGIAGTHMVVSQANYVQGGNSSITGFSVTIPGAA